MEETNPNPQEQPTAEEAAAEQPTAKEAAAEQPTAEEAAATTEGGKAKEEDKKKPKVPKEERFLSAIAYVPPAFILPMITKPGSKYCQFHAKQGLAMFVVDFVVLFILAAIPLIGSVLFVAALVVSVMGIVRAYDGAEWKIPVIGDVMAKVDLSSFVAPAAPKKEEEAPKEETPAEEAPTKEPAETPEEAAPAEETPAEEPKQEEAPTEEQPPQQ